MIDRIICNEFGLFIRFLFTLAITAISTENEIACDWITGLSSSTIPSWRLRTVFSSNAVFGNYYFPPDTSQFDRVTHLALRWFHCGINLAWCVKRVIIRWVSVKNGWITSFKIYSNFPGQFFLIKIFTLGSSNSFVRPKADSIFPVNMRKFHIDPDVPFPTVVNGRKKLVGHPSKRRMFHLE